jgi:DinB superfamily
MGTMMEDGLTLLHRTREETLSLAASLTQVQADFRPAPGRWSAGEILDHLILSEKLYRQLISELIALAKAGRRPVISQGFREVNTSIANIPKGALPFLEVPLTVFNMFVPGFVRDTMTQFRLLPAQNPDIAEPRPGAPVDELRQGLRDSYKQTAALLRSSPGLDYRKLRYQHPLMGDNNVIKILRILALHERRHQSQLRDLLRSSRFPKAA